MKVRCLGKHAPWYAALAAGLAVVIILLIVYGLCEIAPFGLCSLAYWDADIQYLDFYAYFKDVLEGRNSIDYTFSSYLGGSTFGLYAYYLASPFSFLAVLFPREQLPVFFDLIVLMKLALCAATMAYYLTRRFQVRSLVRLPLCVALSAAYALCVWTVFQASNIMWLDAAYLLPVMFLGTWHGVANGRWWVFSVAVGFSLMFGWYTGTINCLFSLFWLAFEIAIGWTDFGGTVRMRVKRAIRILGGYVAAGVVGVLLSAIVLVPILLSMGGSTRGSLSFGMLKNFAFSRRASTFVQSYLPGGLLSLSIYSGMLVLTGLIGVFIAKKGGLRRKVVIALGMALLMLILCWEPFMGLFSLLHKADSYHIRYSYLVSACLVVFAGFYLLDAASSFLKRGDVLPLILVAVGFFIVQAVLNYFNPNKMSGQFLPGLVFEGLMLIALVLGSHKGRRLLCAILLALVAFVDAGTNAKLAFDTVKISNVESFASYASQNGEAVKTLKEREGIIPFRLSAINPRGSGSHQDESLAFGYDSISGYSSIAPANQVQLLSNLGYPTYGNCLTIIPEAILPTDALLGVKYLASRNLIAGLTEQDVALTEQVLSANREEQTISFYENPYAFPLAFTTGTNAKLASPVYQRNGFEYLNSVIGAVLGVDGVYEEVEYETETIESEDAPGIVFRLSVPQEDAVVYGDLTSATKGTCTITLDDGASFKYGNWCARQTFTVPAGSAEGERSVTCIGSVDFPSFAQFYAMNPEKLAEAAQKANERAATVEEFENGSVKLSVDAERGKKLFLSIPYDARWHAYVNGREVPIETAIECLMLIPLDEGSNQVELRYESMSYLPGAAISVAVIAIMGGYGLYRKKRERTAL